MDNKAFKLSEAMLAHEEQKEAERTLEFLRKTMGTYEFEKNLTVKFLEGYRAAMSRVVRQADL